MIDVPKETLAQLRDGDMRAFEEVARLYERPLFGHLTRLLRDRDEAADVLQETLLKLLRAREQIDLEQSFGAWIFTIATRTAFDWLKKAHRLHEVPFENDDADETITEAVSYSSVEESARIADIESALNTLSEHERALVLLHYHEGFQYEELGAMFKLPLNTVKTHLFRARKKLRDLLHATYGY